MRITDPLHSAPNVIAPSKGDNETPLWCFKNLRKGYSFDIKEKAHAMKVINAFERRRDLTWAQLMSRDPEVDGIVAWEMSKLKVSAPLAYKNEKKFLKFYAGKQSVRIIGWRVGRVFEVYWIDTKLDTTDH